MSFIATEDADVHVLCHLGNEAAVSDDITRYRVACSSDCRNLFRALQKYTITFSRRR